MEVTWCNFHVIWFGWKEIHDCSGDAREWHAGEIVIDTSSWVWRPQNSVISSSLIELLKRSSLNASSNLNNTNISSFKKWS